MITEAIIWVFSRLVAFLVGLLPGWEAPAWLTSTTSTLGNAVGHVGMLDGWLPIRAIGTVVVFILACAGLALALRFGRMLLSVATGGGGSAA